MGDFNQVLEDGDKRGGYAIAQCRARSMKDMVDNRGLLDLGFVGPQFTWSNMQRGVARVEERLDPYFCNQAWLQAFLGNQVTHLPRP